MQFWNHMMNHVKLLVSEVITNSPSLRFTPSHKSTPTLPYNHSLLHYLITLFSFTPSLSNLLIHLHSLIIRSIQIGYALTMSSQQTPIHEGPQHAS